MKKTNKKGFTIVELVIVIAVIAILSAVLIPTFSGIVNKARISADTQVARNMNTALEAYTAENGKPADFDIVLDTIEEYGYNIKNLNAKQEGHLYVWDKVNNKIVYVDKDFNAIYPEKYDMSNKANFAITVASSSNQLPEGVEVVFEDADSAKDKLADGGNVALLGDVLVKECSAADQNYITKDTTLNFADNTLKFSAEAKGLMGIRVNEGNVVFEANNGGIVSESNDIYCITVGSNNNGGSSATLTIKGGNYITKDATAVNIVRGTVIIEGGFFKADGQDSKYVVNMYDANRNQGLTSCEIKGGIFVNFNPANNTAEGSNTNFVADGYVVVSQEQADGAIWYQVIAENATVPSGWTLVA